MKKTGRQQSVKAVKPDSRKDSFFSELLLGLVLIVTFMIYSSGLKNEILTFDDNEYFQNYPEVTSLSWNSLAEYFTSYYVIMYQPLPVLTFALNYHFTGADPYPLHLVNIFLHLICVILVYIFINRLTGNKIIGLCVSALFALHPMNVEAVAWISARSSSMYTMFYLLALIYYLKHLKSGQNKYLWITGFWFLFSLFSKAQAVTLPVVLLLLDYYHGRKLLSSDTLKTKIPFFLLSVMFGVITLLDIDTQRNLTEGMLIEYSVFDMFFLLTYSLSFYLFKLIAPVKLCAVYVYPPKSGEWLPPEYYLSALVIITAIALVWRFRDNRNVILGVGLFLITIAINLQVIPSRLFIVTDRYAYFPYIGLYLLPLLLLWDLKKKNAFRFQKRLPLMIFLGGVWLITFITITYQRIPVWANDVVFMTDIIDKNPPVKYLYRAYGNRGFSYKKAGMNEQAIQDFSRSIELNPDDARGYFNRGLVYVTVKNNTSALRDFNTAISLDTTQPLLYSYRGQVNLMLGDTSMAIADIRKCLNLDSTNFEAYNTMATIQFARKEWKECETSLTNAIRYNPEFVVGIRNRGLLYLQTGRTTEACQDFMTASYKNDEESKNYYSYYCKAKQ
jgi:protein O-mannosyl-transferase